MELNSTSTGNYSTIQFNDVGDICSTLFKFYMEIFWITWCNIA